MYSFVRTCLVYLFFCLTPTGLFFLLLAMLERLLNAGANVAARGSNGKTAFELVHQRYTLTGEPRP